MEDNLKVAVMAAFAGDALALGVHWIYDTQKLGERFGRVETMLAPGPDSFHRTKKRGDFTHYGDQTLVLLESLAALKGFDLKDFSSRWRSLFEDYQGYIDQATRSTLHRYAAGHGWQDPGAPSNDLSAVARIAPLLCIYAGDLTALVEAARAQTRMTHSDPLTVDCAEFFARLAVALLRGAAPAVALEEIAGSHFIGSPIAEWVSKGLAAADAPTVPTVLGFGQSCHTPEAFPGVIQILARYPRDLKEAVVQAVMAGGDNAARAMLVGMQLGAYLGLEAVPKDWIEGLARRTYIERLLDAIG